MIEVRCKECGKLLGKFQGKAEIICPRTRCSGMNKFDTETGEHNFIPKHKPVTFKTRTTSSRVSFAK